MNGDNDGTVFTDETGKTWSRTGTPVTKTASPKFGSASAYFDGNSCRITTPVHDDFNFSNGDFTVDFWFKCAAVDVNEVELFVCVPELFRFFLQSGTGSYITFMSWKNSISNWTYLYPNTDNNYATNFFNSVWHHVAVTKISTTIRLFIDGIKQTAETTGAETLPSCSQTPSIGGWYTGSSYQYKGYIDEVRFVKGAGLWSANFTPPTAEY